MDQEPSGWQRASHPSRRGGRSRRSRTSLPQEAMHPRHHLAPRLLEAAGARGRARQGHDGAASRRHPVRRRKTVLAVKAFDMTTSPSDASGSGVGIAGSAAGRRGSAVGTLPGPVSRDGEKWRFPLIVVQRTLLHLHPAARPGILRRRGRARALSTVVRTHNGVPDIEPGDTRK